MTPQMLIVIASGVVFVVGAMGILLLLLLAPNATREESRLATLSGNQVNPRAGRYDAHLDHNRFGSRQSTTESSKAQLANRMVQAGLYRHNSVGFYIFVKVLLSLVPVFVGVAAAMLGTVTWLQGLGVGVILSLVAAILPSFWLDAKKRARQINISRALPDALDVIVVCLEAGLSLRSAISRVAKELQVAHPLLVSELLIVEREIQLGRSSGEALRHFADRFDMEELRSLASVVQQAEKFGASIARALRVHADDLRVKRFQRAEELAQKASVKLLFPTMLFIFPTLYVVLIGPAVFQIIEFFQSFGSPQVGK